MAAEADVEITLDDDPKEEATRRASLGPAAVADPEQVQALRASLPAGLPVDATVLELFQVSRAL
jgi:hypothetical protein